MVAEHVPHGRHLPTTCGRHCSSEHTPRLGFWSLLLVAGHAPHGRHLPSTCGRQCSSEHTSRRLVASVPRPSWSWTTPQRNCPSPTHQTCLLRALSACCTAHLRELPAQAPRSAIDRYFFRFGAEGYARRSTDRHTAINPSNDHRWGLRLLREPIGEHTPSLSEPDRPSRDPLGLRAPSLRSYLGRNRRCSWNVCAFSFGEFSSTRVIAWVSVHTSIRLAGRTTCCSLSARNSTATNLTQLGPLPDLWQSTAFHWASRIFNHHHVRRATVRSATDYSAS